ncbi:MAG: ribosome silencing factor [Treponema sp.]|nr:ribosome silencing factor [Treponema sp.]MCL2272610.1 ribosome silencing factor [Treponema sp.]
MEDMLPEIDAGINEKLTALGDLLREHKGQEVCVLDLRSYNGWTDFFIIATTSSITHIDGLERHIKDFCHENEIDILGFSRKSADDEWRLIDLGSIIIHLMSKNFREFYDLERLWRPIKHAQR